MKKKDEFTEILEQRGSGIYRSLAGFQQECPVIHKGTKGYGYTYADLPTILETINPLLEKYGLGFTQLMEGTGIKTILFHVETGQTIESFTHIPQIELKGMNAFQSAGSGITYYRRYALSSMLGIVTDKDTDAGGEQKPKTLTDQRFSDALTALQEGKTTVEEIKKFNLTPAQAVELDEVANSIK